MSSSYGILHVTRRSVIGSARFHLETASHPLGIRPHVPESVASGFIVLRKPDAVVGDGQAQHIIGVIEIDDDRACRITFVRVL